MATPNCSFLLLFICLLRLRIVDKIRWVLDFNKFSHGGSSTPLWFPQKWGKGGVDDRSWGLVCGGLTWLETRGFGKDLCRENDYILGILMGKYWAVMWSAFGQLLGVGGW